MINFDDVTKEIIKQCIANLIINPYHSERILIIRGSRFGKIIHYLNL